MHLSQSSQPRPTTGSSSTTTTTTTTVTTTTVTTTAIAGTSSNPYLQNKYVKPLKHNVKHYTEIQKGGFANVRTSILERNVIRSAVGKTYRSHPQNCASWKNT